MDMGLPKVWKRQLPRSKLILTQTAIKASSPGDEQCISLTSCPDAGTVDVMGIFVFTRAVWTLAA